MSVITRLKTYANGGKLYPADLNAFEDQMVAAHNAQETPEAWHVVSAGGEPPYVFAASGGVIFYRHFSHVYLAGVGQIGSGSAAGVLFQLPVGYRPVVARRYVVPLFDGSGSTHVLVATDGKVSMPSFSAATSNPPFHLDGINFRAEQ